MHWVVLYAKQSREEGQTRLFPAIQEWRLLGNRGKHHEQEIKILPSPPALLTPHRLPFMYRPEPEGKTSVKQALNSRCQKSAEAQSRAWSGPHIAGRWQRWGLAQRTGLEEGSR